MLVRLGDRVEVQLNERVHALAQRIRDEPSPIRWGAPVPGYASLLVPFDDEQTEMEAALDQLRSVIARLPSDEAPHSGDTVEILAEYGGEAGPDLDDVAGALRLTPAQVVEIHTAGTYRVFLLGFAPGFAYLGPLPQAIRVARRAEPRVRVPAGSVAIAGEQTAVYPFATPGGWQLIGRTSAVMWDLERDPPALLAPGMQVRFRAR